MGAPKGNQFWKSRFKHGRDIIFSSPEMLWEAACEYFESRVEHPLYETKPFAYQGDITNAELPKMRALTWPGLCFHLHCNEAYFRQFNPPNKDFSTVVDDIRQVMEAYNIEGAAAEMLNPNIIARLLGLSDKSEQKIEANVNVDPFKQIRENAGLNDKPNE